MVVPAHRAQWWHSEPDGSLYGPPGGAGVPQNALMFQLCVMLKSFGFSVRMIVIGIHMCTVLWKWRFPDYQLCLLGAVEDFDIRIGTESGFSQRVK